MMRAQLFWILLLSSCMHQDDFSKNTNASSVSVFEHEGLIIISDHGKYKVADLKQTVILVPDPIKEEIVESDWQNAQSFSLARFDSQSRYILKPKKMFSGQQFGVYFREKNSDKAKLIYVFRAKIGQPKLVGHNLGIGPDLKIAENRKYFSFEFDQPIHVQDDEAIEVFADGKKIELSEIEISNNSQYLRISLKNNNAFFGAKEGLISLSRIFYSDAKYAVIAPIKFSIGEKILEPSKSTIPTILVSHNSAEINWRLNQWHRSELYFAEGQAPKDCLGLGCPQESEGIMSSFLITGLKKDTRYYFVIRAEDAQANIIISHGSFKTLASESLRFCEILINPKLPKGVKESSAEFIKLFNSSNEIITIHDMKLIFEDMHNHKEQLCQIATNKKPLIVPARSYILIVGGDFDDKNTVLSENTLLVRLPKNKLCGGLPNDRPQIIKIVGEEGGLLDRFGGHLWRGPEGSSVMRINMLGADQSSNYSH